MKNVQKKDVSLESTVVKIKEDTILSSDTDTTPDIVDKHIFKNIYLLIHNRISLLFYPKHYNNKTK